jgi:hypothetical protein
VLSRACCRSSHMTVRDGAGWAAVPSGHEIFSARPDAGAAPSECQRAPAAVRVATRGVTTGRAHEEGTAMTDYRQLVRRIHEEVWNPARLRSA